jgi:hypothetical protein
MRITVEITATSGHRSDEELAEVVITAIRGRVRELSEARVTGVSWGGQA